MVAVAVVSAATALAADKPDPVITPWPGFAGSFLVARAAEARGDWAMAQNAFADVSVRDAYTPDFVHRQSVLLLNQGRFDDALKLAETMADTGNASHLAHLLVFADAARQNDAASARTALRAISNEGLGQYIKPFFTAWLADNLKDARAALAPVLEMPSIVSMSRLHLALLAEKFGDVDLARSTFARLIAGTPSYRSVALAAGFYARNNMPERREALLKAALEGGVEPSLVARLRANPGYGDQVNTLQGGVAETLFSLAALLQIEGANDVALPYLRIATALRPEFALANLMAGDLMIRLGKYDDARKLYEGEVAAVDVGPMAALRLAALETQLGHPVEARNHLQALVQDAPDWAEAWAQLGDTASVAGDLTSAVSQYTKAVTLAGEGNKDTLARLLYSRAIINHRLRDNAAAEADLQASLKLVPDSAERLNYLGYIWADRGVKLEEAEALITRAMSLEPNNASIIDSLGWVKFRAGNTAEAVRLLELAAEMMPYNAVINDHLGDAYWAAGRAVEARFQWQRAVTYRDAGDSSVTSVEDLRLKLARGLAPVQTAVRQ